ncbi:MAG TPA: response regulator [Candidatus Sulfopaludibacter sp.]|jgi:hypothetical protein|nr:response regulator [Candidatus Sulfopaludibacter sp.]
MQPEQPVRKHILVVEDEGLIADDIRRRLERLGYSVPAVASSGEEALQLAASFGYDLVLMDIRLKGEMDGIAAARKIKENLQIPVVYLTAHADPDTVNRATVTEPFGYILKPIADANLRTTIQIALYKHQMERRLRVSEAWLSTTLRSMGDAIVATDPDGAIVFMNPPAERLTGFDSATAAGLPLMDVLALRDPFGQPACNPLVELLADETRAYQLASRDARSSLVEVACFENRDDTELLGAILVLRDIGMRQEWDDHAIQSQRMDAIASLAGGLARVDSLPAALGGQLTALSRRAPAYPEVIDVNQAIAALRPALTVCLGPDVALETNLHLNTGFIQVDRSRFEQVLINLALRARHDMASSGAFRIVTSILDLPAYHLLTRRYGGSWFVRVEVSHNGPLPDPATLSRIFEPSFSETAGSALDLAIAHSCVVQGGGQITAAAGPENGVVFEILWPCLGTYQDVQPMMRTFPEPAPAILIVEEEDNLRRSLCACIERDGYRLLEARTPEDAALVAAACRRKLDGLVAPAGSELLACRLKLPALYLSGYRHDEVPEPDVLPKPFPILEFRRRLRKLVPEAFQALRDSQ